jgi:hypothetical protein
MEYLTLFIRYLTKRQRKRPYEILYLLRLFSVPDEIERYKKDLEIP